VSQLAEPASHEPAAAVRSQPSIACGAWEDVAWHRGHVAVALGRRTHHGRASACTVESAERPLLCLSPPDHGHETGAMLMFHDLTRASRTSRRVIPTLLTLLHTPLIYLQAESVHVGRVGNLCSRRVLQ